MFSSTVVCALLAFYGLILHSSSEEVIFVRNCLCKAIMGDKFPISCCLAGTCCCAFKEISEMENENFSSIIQHELPM